MVPPFFVRLVRREQNYFPGWRPESLECEAELPDTTRIIYFIEY
jgi:hypothetical protein